VISVKLGVGIVITPANDVIIQAVDGILHLHGLHAHITAGFDGQHHGEGDPHYYNRAVDFGTHAWTEEQKARIMIEIKDTFRRMGALYFVNLEKPGEPEEHLHVERRADVRG
jgi:hypothetical protein